MPPRKRIKDSATLDEIFGNQPTKRDEQLEELQEALTNERDARREDWFIFVAVVTILLDVVFFSVLDGLGGPLALLILQLLILVPMARRLGMEEIAGVVGRILDRVSGSSMRDE